MKWINASIILGFLILLGCQKITPDQLTTDKDLYDKALKLYQDKEYTDAITFFESLKNRFPSSPLAGESVLKIADAHYEKGEYLEAAIYYQNFRSLYPTHEKIPYAIYQTGRCHFREAPKAVDRDQTNLEKTISTLSELLTKWPATEEAKKAAELVATCKRMLLRRDLYVANFYMRQKKYEAALGRLDTVRSQMEFQDLADQAQYTAARAHVKLKNYDAAQADLKPLIENKASPYHKKSVELAEKLGSAQK